MPPTPKEKVEVKDLVDLIDQHLISTTQHTSCPATLGRNTQSTMFVDWDGSGTPRVSYREQDNGTGIGSGYHVDVNGDVRKAEQTDREELLGHMRVDYDWECPPLPERKQARTSVRRDRRSGRGKRVSASTMGTASGISRDSGYMSDSPPSYTRTPRARGHGSAAVDMDITDSRTMTRTEMKFVRQHSHAQARSDVPEVSICQPAPPRYRSHPHAETQTQSHLQTPLHPRTHSAASLLIAPAPTHHTHQHHKLSGFDPATHFQYSYNGSIMHIHRSPNSTYSPHSDYYEMPASEYVDCGGRVKVQDKRKEDGKGGKGKRNSVVELIIKIFRMWDSAGLLAQFSGKGKAKAKADTDTGTGPRAEGKKERGRQMEKKRRGGHHAHAQVQPPRSKHHRAPAPAPTPASTSSPRISRPTIPSSTESRALAPPLRTEKPLPPLPLHKRRTAPPVPKRYKMDWLES